MTFGSLFAGIGGFDLGLERAGMTPAWQVEIDPFATKVLEKHWPHVRRFRDVRECCTGTLRRSRDDGRCAECGRRDFLPAVDLICGGFPCQPHSLAGKRGGASDERDLWPEFRRLIREIRPRWVLAENVPGLLSNDAGRFFGGVLRDLAACGYDAEWQCLPAAAFGARHLRDRVWIVAYPHCQGSQERQVFTRVPGSAGCDRDGQDTTLGLRWLTESPVVRGVHGIPNRVDRVRSLGNAVVPQVVEWIGRRILEAVRD